MSLLASVIIPVFNDSLRIKKVLNALIEQTLSRDAYEIIVVDNGSTDSTPQSVTEYSKKHPDLIHLVFEKETQSSYAARNRGIRQARGEILVFTDSDCIPQANWLEAGIRALQQAPCGGGRILFFFKGERPNACEYFDAAGKLNQQAYVEKAGFAATANFFVRRELFDRYGLFLCDVISGGDYEFGRRLTQAGEKMVYIADAVVRHPARSTLRELLQKRKRVASGQKDLEQMNILEHGRASLRQLIPKLTLPHDPQWKSSLSFLQKLYIVLFQNIFRWGNYFYRLR